MKKLALTFAIVLGISLSSFAQEDGGGLFKYGEVSEDNSWFGYREGDGPLGPGLPGFGESDDQGAPLGSGALLLIGFGAAYALKKRNSKR